MFRIIVVLLFSFQAMAIELVIDGKTYYIEKYEITDNGQRIVIPYTIHLDEKAYDQNAICQRELAMVKQNGCQPSSSQTVSKKRNPYRSISSTNQRSAGSIREGGQASQTRTVSRPRKRKPSGYQKLLNDIDGEYQKLLNTIDKRKKGGKYKRNLR